MKFWNNFLHYTIYRKILISFILTVSIAAIIISITLFSLFSVSSAREIGKISISLLSQINYACDIIYEQVFDVSKQVAVNNDISKAIFSREKNNIFEYHALLNLTYLKTVYSFIKHIGIYNGVTERYLSTNRLPPAKDSEIISRITAKGKNRNYEFFPRKVTQGENPDEPINVLTFILYPNYSSYSTQRSAIVIDVGEEYIQDTIQRISNNPDEIIFVMNSQGIILSHINAEMFLEDFSKKAYITKILHSDSFKGYFIQAANEEKQLITYARSRSLNWFFLSLKVYDKLLFNIYRVRNITIIIAFVFILSGILISFLLTKYIYNPLEVLMNKISSSRIDYSPILQKYNEYDLIFDAFTSAKNKTTYLETRLEKTLPVFKEICLHFLLKQSVRDITTIPGLPNIPEIINDIENQLKSPFYCVLLFKIDGYRNFMEKNNAMLQSVIRLSICNTAHELIGKECRNDAIVMENDEVAVLVQLERNILSEKIILALNEIKHIIKRNFQTTLSVGIGDIVSLRNEINLSYKSAKEYINFRLFYGYGSIIDCNRIKDRYNRNFKYPSTIEKNIIEALKLCRNKIIEQQINKFIRSISTMHYYYTLTYSNQLLISILKCFDKDIDTSSEYSKEFYSIIHQLPQFDTLEEISTVLKNFCFKICDIINEKKISKNKKIIKKIQEYIQENYYDQALNIDMIADMVQLSTGYLGKLFKNIAHTSFNDYLNTIRLEKAKELLISTDDTITLISEKVGIPNFTYFFTLFKKNYGITPALYRSQNSLSF